MAITNFNSTSTNYLRGKPITYGLCEKVYRDLSKDAWKFQTEKEKPKTNPFPFSRRGYSLLPALNRDFKDWVGNIKKEIFE